MGHEPRLVGSAGFIPSLAPNDALEPPEGGTTNNSTSQGKAKNPHFVPHSAFRLPTSSAGFIRSLALNDALGPPEGGTTNYEGFTEIGRFWRRWIGWLFLTLSLPAVLADGGTLLLQEVKGPFRVAVFASPAVLRPGPIDLSVLVQSRDSSEVDWDATVMIVLIPPAGAVIPALDPYCGPAGEAFSRERSAGAIGRYPVRATRAQATNKLLQAVRVEVPVAGNWQLEVLVEHGRNRAEYFGELPVASGAELNATVVTCLALPPVFIMLFVAHQNLSRRPSPRIAPYF